MAKYYSFTGPTNPEQARVTHIQDLCDHLMSYFDAEIESVRQEKVAELALQNQTLLNSNTASFVYGEQWFAAELPLPGPRELKANKWNRLIHPNLYQEIHELLQGEKFEVIEQRSRLQQLFSDVFSEAQHWDDVVAIIPSSFMAGVKPIAEDVFNVGERMSDPAIASIKDKHTDAIQHLKRLGMRRLLLNQQ